MHEYAGERGKLDGRLSGTPVVVAAGGCRNSRNRSTTRTMSTWTRFFWLTAIAIGIPLLLQIGSNVDH